MGRRGDPQVGQPVWQAGELGRERGIRPGLRQAGLQVPRYGLSGEAQGRRNRIGLRRIEPSGNQLLHPSRLAANTKEKKPATGG